MELASLSAIIGTALIPITYLLARRLFCSRGAAVLGAALVLCEGMFLVYSRLALINIAYITFGAAAYLVLFRFFQRRDPKDRRRSLLWMGILLGLGLGSKFAIPGITWLLVVGFMVSSLIFVDRATPETFGSRNLNYILGAVALVGGLSAVFFFLTFLPNYATGWWTGISSLTRYYQRVLLANSYYPEPLSHQDSAWWSWPLMLRPYKYWQRPDDMGTYLTIWGGGNPAIWWAALLAIGPCTVRAVRGDGVSWSFLCIGFLIYVAMWIPIHRALYIYSYMPALYLGILALAGLLDECWKGTARIWEQAAILVPVFAVSLLGLGYLYGAIASILTLVGYVALLGRSKWPGRFACGIFVTTSIAVFLYFLPIWIPTSLTKQGVEARMWLNGVGLGNWR